MDAMIIGAAIIAVVMLIVVISNTKEEKKDPPSKPFKGVDDTEEMKNKFAEAEKRAHAIFNRQQNLINKNNDEKEKYKLEGNRIKFQKRRPSIDDHDKAMNGIGIEIRVIGMKYRSVEAQLAAKSLDSGDVVVLKHEKNEFSKAGAIAVYTTTHILIGYLPAEKCGFVMSLFYDDRLPAYVKTPWEYDKSWFSIVIPGSE